MPFSPDRYVEALAFAARAHGDQETPTGLPYVVHLTSVAMEVIRAVQADPAIDGDLAVACALLHDVLEDTETSREAIQAAFGPRVAAGVAALTKDGDLPKAEAMADSLRRIRQQPPEIAVVKLADRITNLAPPPGRWTAEKIRAYREEAGRILETLGDASPFLAERFRERLAAYPG